jgi:hypothetical protein
LSYKSDNNDSDDNNDNDDNDDDDDNDNYDDVNEDVGKSDCDGGCGGRLVNTIVHSGCREVEFVLLVSARSLFSLLYVFGRYVTVDDQPSVRSYKNPSTVVL